MTFAAQTAALRLIDWLMETAPSALNTGANEWCVGVCDGRGSGVWVDCRCLKCCAKLGFDNI